MPLRLRQMAPNPNVTLSYNSLIGKWRRLTVSKLGNYVATHNRKRSLIPDVDKRPTSRKEKLKSEQRWMPLLVCYCPRFLIGGGNSRRVRPTVVYTSFLKNLVPEGWFFKKRETLKLENTVEHKRLKKRLMIVTGRC